MRRFIIVCISLISISFPLKGNANAYYFDLYNRNSNYYIPSNTITKQAINRYKSYKWFDKSLAVLHFYTPMIEGKLSYYGIPLELKNLILIESAVNPRAISYVGAKGLWQFMPATAKQYHLKWNLYVDLRYDPIASTDAACRYLKYLYKLFKDWNLVLSAYNAGEGTVLKAIKKAGSKNYWKVRPFLPKETRAYVPSFMACCYLNTLQNYYNLGNYTFPYSYSNIQIVKSSKNINLEVLLDPFSKKETEFIKYLNPHLLSNTIPTDTYFYLLKTKK